MELETKPVLKEAIEANRRLANLCGLAAQIPNRGMLINSIVLQEARLSSEIENIVTTNVCLPSWCGDVSAVSTDQRYMSILVLFFDISWRRVDEADSSDAAHLADPPPRLGPFHGSSDASG